MKRFKDHTHQPECAESDERQKLLSALLIEAIGHRSAKGEETTLRDLHTLLDVPQPVALRLAHKLQDEGLAVLSPNLNDAFGSVITLSPAIMARLQASERLGRKRSR